MKNLLFILIMLMSSFYKDSITISNTENKYLDIKILNDSNKDLFIKDPFKYDFYFYHQNEKVDLILSGHTHGGQIFPFGLLVLLDQPYLSGLYQHNAQTQVFVSNGTGYWGPPVRVGAPSEIVKINLKVKNVGKVMLGWKRF